MARACPQCTSCLMGMALDSLAVRAWCRPAGAPERLEWAVRLCRLSREKPPGRKNREMDNCRERRFRLVPRIQASPAYSSPRCSSLRHWQLCHRDRAAACLRRKGSTRAGKAHIASRPSCLRSDLASTASTQPCQMLAQRCPAGKRRKQRRWTGRGSGWIVQEGRRGTRRCSTRPRPDCTCLLGICAGRGDSCRRRRDTSRRSGSCCSQPTHLPQQKYPEGRSSTALVLPRC